MAATSPGQLSGATILPQLANVPDHSAVRDLLAAHLIDPDTTPVHDIDPDQFVPPAEIANRSTSHL